ncbi:nuclease-related domain-containing protein [Ruania albidiflava]|uniref:nuclease-related domain-containing protein n=1 Tax=Ruania albidiflava TaxID=366586 RepID=UPI0003B4691A|nr:nuclease-related domain-containing protein [Ruania albidiflava]
MTDQIRDTTPYQVLGVSPEASPEALRRAYRRALRRTHPDTGGDADSFLAVQQAWQLVGTQEARHAYDAAHAGERAAYDGGAHPGGATSGSARAASRAAGNGHAGGSAPGRVWTAGSTAGGTRAPSRARSYGHPGGWSRERYLTLLREWVGRGVSIDDPYEARLVASAPREIRHALADAQAEEATARLLADLGSAFTVWHDVATGRGNERWARDASAGVTNPAKIDHVVLGPTGLFVLQSEDWGAPVTVKGKKLHCTGLAKGTRPMKELAHRARIARHWGVRLSALVIVLDDDALTTDLASLGSKGSTARFVVRRRVLATRLATGLPGVAPLSAEDLFAARTALQRTVQFV